MEALISANPLTADRPTRRSASSETVGRRAGTLRGVPPASRRAAVAAPAVPAARFNSNAPAATPAPAMVGRFLLGLGRATWMLFDIALVCGGSMLGRELFVWWDQGVDGSTDYRLLLTHLVLATSVILAGCVVGLYESGTLWSRSRIIVRCLLTVILAMLGAWLVMHLLMYSNMSRRAAATGALCYLVAASAVRLACHHAVQDVRRGLIIVGQGPLTGAIARSVRRGRVPGYRLVGFIVSDLARMDTGGLGDMPVAGRIRDVDRLCRERNVAEVVMAESAMRDPEFQRTALACLKLGCRVTDEATFYETTYGEVPVLHITPHWFLAADLKGHLQEHAVLKRLFDVAVAAVALVLLAPVFFLVALAIFCEGRGRVLYSQTRVGQGGRPFTLYKFRTMRADAESAGTTWAAPNDGRVTRVGRLLRRLRLDEIPQFWNILRGDMSVVGPRPERPEFVAPLSSLIPYYDERHLLKPGLTGWAQINYPYGGSIADARQKLQLDLYYVKRISLELDLIILLRTLGTFFRGAR